MTNLTGGAESHARSKQYHYQTNSNLVLTSDSNPTAERTTGEPESLSGKINPKNFGDRAFCHHRPTKNKRNLIEESDSVLYKRRRLQSESVLTDTDYGVYEPKSKETRAAYEALLSVIQEQFGGQPLDIVRGAADEILAVLKNDTLLNKRKDIEKVLNDIPDQVFNQLVLIGKLITDFQEVGDVDCGLDSFDGDVGVAVEFEDNEEEDDEGGDVDVVDEVTGKTLWSRKDYTVEGQYDEQQELLGRSQALDRLVNAIVEGAQSQW
jgi:pre-mRNA-splicing helicase BRR2